MMRLPLFVARTLRKPRAMRRLVLLVLALATPALVQAAAKEPPKGGPQPIGTFEDWIAATNKEAGQTVCYAFTRAHGSAPKLDGRGDVVLTVTERQGGRDAVAVSAGFSYAANAAVKFLVDATAFEFYTAQRSAFARDGHAVVQAMQHGRQAVAHSPGPKGAEIADTFSLKGFSAAYAAITKRCPAGK
jgi:invasion protein IalB